MIQNREVARGGNVNDESRPATARDSVKAS